MVVPLEDAERILNERMAWAAQMTMAGLDLDGVFILGVKQASNGSLAYATVAIGDPQKEVCETALGEIAEEVSMSMDKYDLEESDG